MDYLTLLLGGSVMLKAYEEYKYTDIPWYEKIPSCWKINRGKTIFNNPKEINKDGTLENVLSLTLKGVIRNNADNPVGLSPKSYHSYQIFEKDDLVFKLIDLENVSTSRVGLVWEKGIMSPAYIRVELKNVKKQNMKFFYYQYYSMYQRNIFNGLGSGVRQTLSGNDLLLLKIPVPSKPEQDQIVRYLDWKTSEMNRFIHQKKKQIKMLEDLKQNYIDHLITNGNDNNREKYISKADWMEKIPKDWKEYRLKNLVWEINNRSELGLEPHLSMSQKKGLVTDDEEIERRLLSESYAGAKICEKDDLVLNRLKAHLGVFALAPIKGVVSSDYTVLRIKKEKVIPQYLEYLLKSNACRRELVTRVRGIVEGFWRLYTEDLVAIPISVPSIYEQKKLLEEITETESKINILIQSIQKEISLVEELKVKLISDVVTGQVDVRDEIIPVYEMDSDADERDDDVDEELSCENIDEE